MTNLKSWCIVLAVSVGTLLLIVLSIYFQLCKEDMKQDPESMNEAWSRMARQRGNETYQFGVDLLGLWKSWQRKKIDNLMERSRAYWQSKRRVTEAELYEGLEDDEG